MAIRITCGRASPRGCRADRKSVATRDATPLTPFDNNFAFAQSGPALEGGQQMTDLRDTL